jgi:hypothetical protein
MTLTEASDEFAMYLSALDVHAFNEGVTLLNGGTNGGKGIGPELLALVSSSTRLHEFAPAYSVDHSSFNAGNSRNDSDI